MRAGPSCTDDQAVRYQAALEMAAWADDNHFDVIGLSEHHDTPDGFLSAPLSLASMMLARTQRIRVSVSALLVPLHDPLRLAEEIAVLDLLAPGRFTATCGLGYRRQEYDRFSVDWKRRGEIFDEKLAVLVPALQGKSFHYNGSEMQLNPKPTSAIQSLLTIGGNSKAAARRAAKFSLLFCPAIDDPELDTAYQEACREFGVKFGFTLFPRRPATTFISEDPKASWKAIGEHLLYDATSYAAWRHPNRRAYAESSANTIEELIAEEKYRILTPEQAIQVVQDTGSFHLAPLTGGVPVELGWQSLRLYEEKVLPFIDFDAI